VSSMIVNQREGQTKKRAARDPLNYIELLLTILRACTCVPGIDMLTTTLPILARLPCQSIIGTTQIMRHYCRLIAV